MLDVVSLDAPVCLSIHKLHYGVAKFEEAKIECEVDADPADVKFEWEFNNTAAEKLDIFSFTSEGQRSVATYTPKVEMDYGVLYCWAINSVGKMTEPCVFFVIQAGTQIIIVHLVMIMPLASSFQCPVLHCRSSRSSRQLLNSQHNGTLFNRTMFARVFGRVGPNVFSRSAQ